MSVLNKIRENVEPIVLNLGINVWDVLFEKEGTNKFLRVYIFKGDGVAITLDDCEKVSLKVSEKLDEMDIIEEKYFLEVSSVGTERKLTKEKHFLNSIGKNVHIKFKKSYGGKKHLKGILKDFENSTIKLETSDEIFSIPFKNCLYVKLDEKKEE